MYKYLTNDVTLILVAAVLTRQMSLPESCWKSTIDIPSLLQTLLTRYHPRRETWRDDRASRMTLLCLEYGILNSLYVLVATFIQGTPDLCVYLEQQPPVTLFVSEVS